jgi:hypothetical protein
VFVLERTPVCVEGRECKGGSRRITLRVGETIIKNFRVRGELSIGSRLKYTIIESFIL